MKKEGAAGVCRLPLRLATIAGEIRRGESLADIGTDQGLLPVALYRDGICPQVIATDVSQASLERARRHWMSVREACGEEGLDPEEENVSFRAGDGLTVLQPGEVDVVVIAGMGGKLIRSMLERDEDHAASFPRYIFQPRKDAGLVRHWLAYHGYSLAKDLLVPEGRHISEIIVAQRGDETEGWVCQKEPSPMTDIAWDVPPWLGKEDPAIRQRFLNQRLAWELDILEQMGEAMTPARQEVEERVEYLKKLGAKHEIRRTD